MGVFLADSMEERTVAEPTFRIERQVNELNAAPANSPATASHLAAPPMEADSATTPTAQGASTVDSSGPKED